MASEIARFPSLLRFTRCRAAPAEWPFLQRVDRRKRLGGAESRSVGGSGGPIPAPLSHLKTRAAKEPFGTSGAQRLERISASASFYDEKKKQKKNGGICQAAGVSSQNS